MKLLTKEEVEEFLEGKGVDIEDFFEYADGAEITYKGVKRWQMKTILRYLNR